MTNEDSVALGNSFLGWVVHVSELLQQIVNMTTEVQS